MDVLEPKKTKIIKPVASSGVSSTKSKFCEPVPVGIYNPFHMMMYSEKYRPLTNSVSLSRCKNRSILG